MDAQWSSNWGCSNMERTLLGFHVGTMRWQRELLILSVNSKNVQKWEVKGITVNKDSFMV